VDSTSIAGQSIRYSNTQNLGSFRRRTFDAANNLLSTATPTLTPDAASPNITGQFVTPVAVNVINGARLAIAGANGLYESTDRGDNITRISTQVVNRSALVYGGVRGGVNNPDLLWFGAGSQVFTRTTAGGAITATAAAFPGGTVLDIAVDPADWQTAYVTDGAGVWQTTDLGATWTNLSGNLNDNAIQTLEFIGGATADAVLAGGILGVSRMLTTAQGLWNEFGAALPNATVWDMDYNEADDILVIGTLGRGAWSVSAASTTVFNDGNLVVDGTSGDDVIRLIRNANNPLILDVIVNGTTEGSFQLSVINNITVNGLAGNDNIILDGANGTIQVLETITLNGNADNDTLEGAGGGQDGIGFNGGGGNDSLLGSEFDDAMSGGTGNDTLDGRGGADDMQGGDGLDTADYSDRTADLVIDLDDNADDGEAGENDNVHSDIETVLGGSGDDSITGSNADNLLVGNDGNDTLNGEGGADTLQGNAGDDEIHGGDGADSILGGSEDDDLFGDDGDDTIRGGDGDDSIEGGQGADSLFGDAGNDTMRGGPGNDTMFGGTGNDSMFGDDGDDSMLGEDGNDLLNGGAGSDFLDGGAGFDSLLGGAGNDTINGGADDDYIEGNEDNDSITGGGGEDDLIGGSSIAGTPDGADFIDGGDSHDVIAGDNAQITRTLASGGDFERYNAGTPAGTGRGLENNAVIRTVTLLDNTTIGGNDTLVGGAGPDSGDDTIHGQFADDTITAGDGHDDITGGVGADTIDGGAGDDGILGDMGTITPDLLDGSTEEFISSQDKKVQATINTAGTRKRLVSLTDPATGGDDLITAGTGNDSVHGGAGADTISGNDGDDALFGNAGPDSIKGGAGGDHLYGGADNDLLDGEAGADTNYGGGGDDSLFADQLGDRLADWFGNFNDFYVPGQSYGAKIIIRSPAPAMREFFTYLAAGDGAVDPFEEIDMIVPPSPENAGPGGTTK
jgi:Ca2+-binding RTX toxin-like protein